MKSQKTPLKILKFVEFLAESLVEQMENSFGVSEKDKIKQVLSSLDIFKILGSCLLVVGITLNILNRSNQERKVLMAKTNAKTYAEELVIGAVKSTHVRTLRNPASAVEKESQEGQVGIDPWGKPYSYKVIQNSYGQPIYMVVVSAGPNSTLDTLLGNVGFETRKNSQIEIMGDDVGYLKSFR